MTQRNPQNARYKEGGKKNVTRKSAGSAKPKTSAGSSVYVSSNSSSRKNKDNASKSKQASEKERQIIAKGMEAANNYRHYRRIWLATIVVAIIAVVLSFASPRVMVEGGLLPGLAPYSRIIQTISLVVGYAALIAALVVDFKNIRPIRKAQSVMNKKETKKERAHREQEEAEKEAARAAKKAKSPFKRKKDEE